MFADVSTIASMFIVMATPGENEYYGIFGGGVGLGYSMVDTSYKSEALHSMVTKVLLILLIKY